MKKEFKTSSSINLKPFYTQKDWNADQKESSSLGVPGRYPFTRGVYENMYREKLWSMRQYAGFGSAIESNKRYLKLLKEGSTGLSVAFDLPTQMGYDSDHIMSTGEVGKVGVSISSIEDMELLFKDISFEKISTSMTINSTAAILLALYIVCSRRKGCRLKNLRGTVQNDLLKEYIARGTYIFPPKPSLQITTDIFEFLQKEIPKWNGISVSGYHIREAGSSAMQELAFTLANAITYVEAALERGLDIHLLGKQLSFFFNVQSHFFEEIAKFRAARRMWALIMKERFKALDLEAKRLRFHAQTAGVSLTASQPENNITRVTLQALASVLGGTQSLHTNSMDEALGLPTEKTSKIALRTQQILAYESGVGDVVDPLGGSFYVETLTDEIERRAFKCIEKIDSMGGMLSCIERGWVQSEIEEEAYKFHQKLESGENIIVGVNAFDEGQSGLSQEGLESIQTFKVSEESVRDQIQRLRRFKKKRNQKKCKDILSQIQKVADKKENLMPFFIEAVDLGATLGEISDALRKVFGEYN